MRVQVKSRVLQLDSSAIFLLWVAGAVGALGLMFYASEAGAPGWEVAIVQFLQGLQVPGLRELDLLLTRAGHTPLALPLTALAVAVLALAGHGRLALLLAIATSGRILGGVIKIAIDRPRPDAGQVDLAHVFGGPSFPSGHVLGTTILFGWLAYSAIHVIPHRPSRLAVQALCVAIMLLMGISRLELGAHWPTDVLGGYLVAALFMTPFVLIHRRLEPRSL
jgi:undecaprenyl-diphosphatase